jgi:hypothetical protein
MAKDDHGHHGDDGGLRLVIDVSALWRWLDKVRRRAGWFAAGVAVAYGHSLPLCLNHLRL